MRGFSIEFNCDVLGNPMSPGLYQNVTAESQLKWYLDHGVDVIQTFCMGLNGYAWYRSKIAPVEPGLNGNFLKDLVRIGHEAGVEVHGYFNPVGDASYRVKHCYDESSVIDRRRNQPLTTELVDYYCRCIEEAVRETGIDGFLIDWLDEVEPLWIPAEKQMYEELTSRKFPEKPIKEASDFPVPWKWFGESKLPVFMERQEVIRFRRLAIERAWKKFREAAKSVNPNVKIWINPPFRIWDLDVFNDNLAVKEADIILSEGRNLEVALWLRKQVPETPIFVNFGGLRSDGKSKFPLEDFQKYGFHHYGFARPEIETGVPSEETLGKIADFDKVFFSAGKKKKWA
jgi:hypothetical protein